MKTCYSIATYHIPVSTIPDHRQGVLLLLVRRSILGNEVEVIGKSEPDIIYRWINSQNKNSRRTRRWGVVWNDNESGDSSINPINHR